MLILLSNVSVLVLVSSFSVLVLFTGVFVGLLNLIWSIIMLEFITKTPVDNDFNH